MRTAFPLAPLPLIFFLLLACNDRSEAATSDEGAEAITEVTTAVDAVDDVHPLDDTDNLSGIEKLEGQLSPERLALEVLGRWQSVEDPKSGLYITNDDAPLFVDYYEGEAVDAGTTYRLVDDCATSDSAPGRYLKLGDDRCFFVVSLDATAGEMKLSYVGRGNTLSYVRVQD